MGSGWDGTVTGTSDWDRDWRFFAWYVNLQSPLLVRGNRFDTTDWALDVVVDPDGTWHWKDEGEFGEAIELGVCADADASLQCAVKASASSPRHRGRPAGRTGDRRPGGCRCPSRATGPMSDETHPRRLTTGADNACGESPQA